MVGLPGRGKTFLCNKLRCYLSWLGHNTAHINVGQYRRLQRQEGAGGATGGGGAGVGGAGGGGAGGAGGGGGGSLQQQDASFFDAANKAGVEARNRALDAALADLMAYVESEHGQVAIFDATNSTVGRRQKLVRRGAFIFVQGGGRRGWGGAAKRKTTREITVDSHSTPGCLPPPLPHTHTSETD